MKERKRKRKKDVNKKGIKIKVEKPRHTRQTGNRSDRQRGWYDWIKRKKNGMRVGKNDIVNSMQTCGESKWGIEISPQGIHISMTTLSFLLATLVELSVGKICSHHFNPIIWGKLALVVWNNTENSEGSWITNGKKHSEVNNMYWCFFMERVKGPKRFIKCQIHKVLVSNFNLNFMGRK